MCEHEIAIKIENGMIVTYCKKCGKILDTKPANTNNKKSILPGTSNNEVLKDNGGSILHD